MSTGAPFIDWSISAGNAIFNLLLLALVGWFTVRSKTIRSLEEVVGKLHDLLQEFPPHRHVDGQTIYPRSMKGDLEGR